MVGGSWRIRPPGAFSGVPSMFDSSGVKRRKYIANRIGQSGSVPGCMGKDPSRRHAWPVAAAYRCDPDRRSPHRNVFLKDDNQMFNRRGYAFYRCSCLCVCCGPNSDAVRKELIRRGARRRIAGCGGRGGLGSSATPQVRSDSLRRGRCGCAGDSRDSPPPFAVTRRHARRWCATKRRAGRPTRLPVIRRARPPCRDDR